MFHPLASIMGIHFKPQLYISKRPLCFYVWLGFIQLGNGKACTTIQVSTKTLIHYIQDSLPHKLKYIKHNLNHHIHVTIFFFLYSIHEGVFPTYFKRNLSMFLRYISHVFGFGYTSFFSLFFFSLFFPLWEWLSIVQASFIL